VAGLFAALLGMSLIVIPSASGDPISDAQTQAAALARRINDEDQTEEILAEQFDGARVHADQVNAQLAAAGERMTAAQGTVDRTHAALASEAVTAYMHGGYVSTPEMNAFSGHDDLAVEQGYFDLATNNQADVIARARSAQAQLRVQQAALQVAKADASAAVVSLTARRTAVEQADAATRQTLAQVKGRLVQLVAAQQAQIAAQQQAQEQAVLAAQVTPAATSTTVAAPKVTATTARVAATLGTRPLSPSTTRPPTTVRLPPTTTSGTTPAVPVVAPGKVAPPPAVPPPASSRGLAAVAFAKAQLGKPYEFGAAGPDSYDCSGLTMMAWAAAGVSLDHYAADQYANTTHIPIADLQPGDLVFYGTDLHHVGIYVGGGMMIDAPNTGSVVRYDTIFWPDLQPFGGRPG
jgi:cell wall-associated NlpC family hydrolase